MYCSKCGVALVDGKCPVCGNTETNVASSAPITNNSTNNDYYYPPSNNSAGVDKGRTGLNIVSFLMPLAGLIFYCVWFDTLPIKAKSCAKWTIIGIIIRAVLLIGSYGLLMSAVASLSSALGQSGEVYADATKLVHDTLAMYLPF